MFLQHVSAFRLSIRQISNFISFRFRILFYGFAAHYENIGPAVVYQCENQSFPRRNKYAATFSKKFALKFHRSRTLKSRALVYARVHRDKNAVMRKGTRGIGLYLFRAFAVANSRRNMRFQILDVNSVNGLPNEFINSFPIKLFRCFSFFFALERRETRRTVLNLEEFSLEKSRVSRSCQKNFAERRNEGKKKLEKLDGLQTFVKVEKIHKKVEILTCQRQIISMNAL